MKRFLLTFFIAFAAGIGSMTYADIYEGSCSETVFWKLDDHTGLLTIYGEGDIPFYSESGGSWLEQMSFENVFYVAIEEGITGIGDYSFHEHRNLKAVSIASTVTYIGSYAFTYCSSLEKIVFKNPTPPDLGECPFCDVYVGIFYIPVGSFSAYYSAGFGDYCETFEEGTSGSILPIPAVFTQLPDTNVCYGSYVQVGTCGEYVYYNKTISCTLTSYAGGDSIVSQFVTVYSVEMPYVIGQNINGYNTTGSIRIFDTYQYWEGESEVYRAKYDYITINDVRYDHKPAAGESSVNINAITSSTNASFEIQDLAPGYYEIKFFMDDCSNATQVTAVEIFFQYVYVDGLYYNSYTEYDYDGSEYKQVVRMEVTHREYAESNSYSMSKIDIPDSIAVTGQKYAVKRIGSSAFYKCTNLTSVSIPNTIQSIQSSAFSGCSNLNEITLYPQSTPSVSWNSFSNIAPGAIFYVPINLCQAYRNAYNWADLNIQPAVKVNAEVGPTSCTLTFDGFIDEITSCAIKDGEKVQGNVIDYIGLEPNSTYSNVEFVVYSKDNVSAALQTTFKTESLELITLESKPTSNTSAILLAQTNLDAGETRCGFEWKRNDAPSDMAGKKEYATTANGIMAGRLMGLREDVYYKYRAFYESAAGNMYYGGWQYIFTGDAGVEFEPIIYTEGPQQISERGAILRGYALEGSDPITEQGFEYWAESRVRVDEAVETGMEYVGSSELGKLYIVEAEGIAMQTTLTELDPGTLYKYRAYAKAGGKTYYGTEAAFITLGAYSGSELPTAVEQVYESPETHKLLRNGQIFIIRDGRTYTVTGQEVRE